MTETKPEYIITYPYPPIIQMPDGSYCETLDYPTLVKLVYSLRDRVNKLEEWIEDHDLSEVAAEREENPGKTYSHEQVMAKCGITQADLDNEPEPELVRAQLAAVTAERDRARAFQPMSTFKPKADKLQNYLVLYGDGDIDIATFENTENPEERVWYVLYEINEIKPYGWMELPEPIVKEPTNG